MTSHSATLRGVVNPANPGSPGRFQFQYARSSTECEAAQTFSAPSAPGATAGHSPEAVEAHVTGLLPNSAYTVCLLAENKAFEGSRSVPFTFHTPTSAPEVAKAVPHNVRATSVDVATNINPGGLTATYTVQYETEAAFAEGGWSSSGIETTAGATLAASSEAEPVTEPLLALQPATRYHVRFLASNSDAEMGLAGEEAVFATLSRAESADLPDHRGYELVSTPGSVETYLPATPRLEEGTPETLLPFVAAEDGSALVYAADPAAGSGTGETGNGLGNQWLARATPTGWTTRDITPEHNLDSVYQEFSSTLTSAIFEGVPQLSVEPPTACQRPLYSTAMDDTFSPLFAIGGEGTGCGRSLASGHSADESERIFQTEAALTPNAVEAIAPPPAPGVHGNSSVGAACEWGCNLYAARDGHLTLVNTLAGVDVPNANFGGYAGGTSSIDLSSAISDTGNRIFWTDTTPGPGFEHIFVLENETEQVQVSGPGMAQYWTATPDGRLAYYTEQGALWQFDTSTNSRSQVTAQAGVVGVLGTNTAGEDGAWLYAVASGKLAPEASPRVCETLEAQQHQVIKEHEEEKLTQKEYEQKFGELLSEELVEHEGGIPAHTGCNLYAIHGETTRLVAVLSPTDARAATSNLGLVKNSGDWSADPGERTSEVSKDGEHIVFQSVRPLTGYNSAFVPREGGARLTSEAFVYDAATSELDCASCQPGGEAPVVREVPEEATKLPVSAELMNYQRRWMSENGQRIFFDSIQPLVAQAVPGIQGVYEWEHEGEGTCTAQSPQRASRGCITLLSGASSSLPSFLIDADKTGDNVFFEHVGSLGGSAVPSDRNEIYDARTGALSATSSTGCLGATCESVVTPESAVPPTATNTFNGIGNFPPPTPAKPTPLTSKQKLAKALKSCRKKRSRTLRSSCEAQARKKYGPKGKARPKPSRSSKKKGHR